MRYPLRLVKNSIKLFKSDGLSGIVHKVPHHARYVSKHILNPRMFYGKWLKDFEQQLLEGYLSDVEITNRPKISILMPLYNVSPEYFKKALSSIQAQSYDNWELCIHNDGSDKFLENVKFARSLSERNGNIKFSTSDKNENIALSLNHALDLATGDYFVMVDNDDELHPRALEMLVRTLNDNPDLRYIYSDEDKLDSSGKRIAPLFRPDWSPHFTLSMMYTTHVSLFETSLVREIGGFRKGFESVQDYDLVLRYTEHIDREQIAHIPLILYHWREVPGSTAIEYDEKGNAKTNARKALNETIQRRGLNATVEDGLTKPSFRIRYEIKGEPKVTILIPTYNQFEVLKVCIDSVLEKTDYSNFEIKIINNNSDEEATLNYLKEIETQEKISVVDYPGEYNFPAINNFGVGNSEGEYVLLLNNDTEVINDEWLSSMLELAQLPEVGAVGAMLIFKNDTYQHTGIITGINDVAGHSFRKNSIEDPGILGQAHVIRDVSAVTAACLLVKRSLYDQVGGLNEDLRIAHNDVDFCLELEKAGYYNVYTPYARLYHYESLSRGSDEAPERVEEFNKETKYMWDKWGDRIANDPYYNANLTKRYEDFSLNINLDKE